jgi:hypothetical protein
MHDFVIRLFRAAPALLLTFALGSCGPEKNQFAPACPIPGLVRPLAELTRYSAASQDLRDLVVHARILDIAGKCENGDNKNTVVTTVQVVIDATRGPAMQGDAMGLPVFVAITDANNIYDKRLFYLPVQFAPNVDNVRARGPEIRMEIPVTLQKTAAAYGIIAGFQLTPEEIAAWRRNNRR